ncbi:MAG: hypothetical protein KBA81_03130 [Rhabdochlamydiaceae bacterium]|nr:hypothetical protein [Rhabdochlamydiaceae bacterium]
MTTPSKISYLDSAYKQPTFRTETNQKDTLIRWLLEVKEIAPYANEEGWSDFAALASTVPSSAYESQDALEVVEIVKRVANTKKFNKELDAKVDATLYQLTRQKV